MPDDKKIILMIDDDMMLLKLYEMAVQAHQNEFELVTAESTLDAMKLATEKKPDVILLDLILGKEPGAPLDDLDKAHGFNFLLTLKGDEATKQIPVIIFSNLDTRQDHEKALSLGAASYIVKAKSSPEEVLKQLKDVMELEAAAQRIEKAVKGRTQGTAQ